MCLVLSCSVGRKEYSPPERSLIARMSTDLPRQTWTNCKGEQLREHGTGGSGNLRPEIRVTETGCLFCKSSMDSELLSDKLLIA